MFNKAKKALFSLRNILPKDRISLIAHLKLFDSCIKPIALYNSEIWAIEYLIKEKKVIENCYKTFPPEALQSKFLKVVLGTNRSAMNSAILAETGRFPLALTSLKDTIIGFWHHMANSPWISLVNKTYAEDKNTNINYCKYIESFLSTLSFSHVWENQNTFSINRLKKAIHAKLRDRYIKSWKDALCNEKSTEYSTKLQTYKTFKLEYKMENYLSLDIEKLHVTKFTKLRISNSNLMIEEGRYKKLKPEERRCPLCKSGIEDEPHFLVTCPCLNDPRLKLYSKLNDILPDFLSLNNNDKFKLMMSTSEIDLNVIIVKGISVMFDKRRELLEHNLMTS